ncbi:MAG: limonene-1,2-epoxide hydrolase [Anaerolineales bacterium]|jgi:limonene-1,2-epoxide hydrolase
MDNSNDRTVLEPLTVERIRELWGKTYNKEGKPDWSHLFPYYHDEIVFQDSIQVVEGKSDFMDLCQRLTDRCEQLSMDIYTIAEAPGYFLFDWEMVMTFRKWPSSSIYGSTKITIAEDNRIIRQRDYFDLWGDIFNNIPYFHKPYRRFMKRYFG